MSFFMKDYRKYFYMAELLALVDLSLVSPLCMQLYKSVNSSAITEQCGMHTLCCRCFRVCMTVSEQCSRMRIVLPADTDSEDGGTV